MEVVGGFDEKVNEPDPILGILFVPCAGLLVYRPCVSSRNVYLEASANWKGGLWEHTRQTSCHSSLAVLLVP